MPYKTPHACAHPGCPGLTREHYCSIHAPQHAREANRHYDANRPSSSERGYGAAWKKLRDDFLKANPICCDPYGDHKRIGVQVSAKVVDHIIPRKMGGRDTAENFEPLCLSCHMRKTAISDGGFGNKKQRPNT